LLVSEHIAAIGELLRVRLGSMVALAVLAVVGVLVLSRTLRVLEQSGRIRATTNPSQRSLLTDLTYLLTSPIMEVLSRTLVTLAVAVAAGLAGRHLSPELFSGFGPVMRQPLWLIVFEMHVFSDLVYYWVHRAAHTVPVLWRFHAIHHSTEHLRWTSALRAHPLEVYVHVAVALPLFVLGFPLDVFAAILAVSAVYALVIHANVNVSAGYLLNSPRFHAWHHARDVKDGVVNFAGCFPIIDALFGTYKVPDHLPPDYGVDDLTTLEVPEDFLAQLKYPFRRRPEHLRAEKASMGPVARCPEAEH
jgi:sterol desaturase/sphingolipid hydroxylase (fatty acid hydroxylase superfamily)